MMLPLLGIRRDELIPGREEREDGQEAWLH